MLHFGGSSGIETRQRTTRFTELLVLKRKELKMANCEEEQFSSEENLTLEELGNKLARVKSTNIWCKVRVGCQAKSSI